MIKLKGELWKTRYLHKLEASLHKTLVNCKGDNCSFPWRKLADPTSNRRSKCTYHGTSPPHKPPDSVSWEGHDSVFVYFCPNCINGGGSLGNIRQIQKWGALHKNHNPRVPAHERLRYTEAGLQVRGTMECSLEREASFCCTDLSGTFGKICITSAEKIDMFFHCWHSDICNCKYERKCCCF